jgi:hypothetical protein
MRWFAPIAGWGEPGAIPIDIAVGWRKRNSGD